MQPFDWQATSAALMEDRYREMVQTLWRSEALRAERSDDRLSFAARLRVFLTGRIGPNDLPAGQQPSLR